MPRLEAAPGSLCADLLTDLTKDHGAIVLDLRGNEGGNLKAVPNVASHFLDPDQPLFHVKLKAQTEDYVSHRCGPAPLKSPLAILVDERTDSGGLLLAAVLQSQRRATLIGRTKGAVNGSIYNVYASGSGAGTLAVKVPVGELVLPGNRRLADGVQVDMAIPPQDEAALLQAARQSLGEQISKQ
jgi:C-terminal processing protease CtpA/Prc